MTVEDKFNQKNIALQEKVLSEIYKVKEGVSKKNISQLETILKELRNSEKEKGIILRYPRIIIDSWEFTDTLGIELIELADMYKKIK